MFQLIVAVISIALVAVLAGASIFYGGSAYSGANAKGGVTSLVNQGQQIAGAGTLFSNDNAGTDPADIAALVSGDYLQAAPTPSAIAASGAAWDIDARYAFVQLDADAAANACVEVTKQNGNVAQITTAFNPADTTALDIGAQFNCVGDATSGSYFVFRM